MATMTAAIALRSDFTGADLRHLARRTLDAKQARRLLALATICDGGSRSEAARIGDVGLQIVRDWVLRFNAAGPDGLVDRKAPGPKRRLTGVHRKALVAIIESGPIPAVHGVVRWRLVDLCQWQGGVPGQRGPADTGPRVARAGLSQAQCSAPPSCPGRGSDRPF
jgi:transposase